MSSSNQPSQQPASSQSPAPDQSSRQPSTLSDSKAPVSLHEGQTSRSLKDIVADELEKSGLGGIDNTLLKLLLIRKLSTVCTEEAPSNSVLDLVLWQHLGKGLTPQLAANGSNFPAWSAALQNLIHVATGVKDFLSVDRSSVDPVTSAQVVHLIQHSVDASLRSSLNSKTAYEAYTSLKERFAGSSWSLLLDRWADVAQAPDNSDSISAGYDSLKRSLLDLEERLGGWTTDKLLSLSFHSSLKRYHQQLADTIDFWMSFNPDVQVKSVDLLNIASRLGQSSSTSSPTVTAVSSQGSLRGNQGRGSGRSGGGGGHHTSAPSAQQTSHTPPPDSWGSGQYLTASFPCNVCWEWGHWANDCPRVRAGLPPLEDPRLKTPGWRPKKSSVLSNRLISYSGELVSVSATPEEADVILCDPGVTHHPGFP